MTNLIIPNLANSSIPNEYSEDSTKTELTIKFVDVPTSVSVPPRIAA